MKIDKQTEIMALIFFFGGLALCVYTLRSTEGILSILGIGMLFLSAFIGGKKEGYREFNRMHYTALEEEAKKRRAKDEEISRKVKKDIEEMERDEQNKNNE